MNTEKRVAVINASPKTAGKSVSGHLASYAQNLLSGDNLEIRCFSVRESIAKKTAEAFKYMKEADAFITIFPLYVFCLPGILMRFLQNYHNYTASCPDGAKKAAVYAIVNCGFPEPEINAEAVRVIGSFSEKIGAQFRFGVMIGGGGMLLGSQGSPILKKTMADIDGAFARIKEEIVSGRRGPAENVVTNVRFPRRLYFFMGGIGWVSWARKNRLKKKDLYAKPYAHKRQ